ncbi:MAG: DUF4962 domain-containing protein [Chloroflexi bacterium]|nr:DUF4962 domain-containing protein [Chloroflexota bacterium]
MSASAREYLLLRRHSLDEWRAMAQTSHASQAERLLRQANSHHDELPPPEHPSDSITYIGTAVLNLALAFLLSSDEAHLLVARRWIKSAIAYPHWGKERMPDHDLDAAWLLFGLGLGYDWLKDVLPPAERIALRDKLAWQGEQLYQYALETEGRWWSSAYWQNHNWICYGGLATVAYALDDELESASSWAARARNNFAQALAFMAEDGSFYEGPVYWRYSFIWFLIYADLLLQQTGENLHESDFLRNTFFYRLYLCGPNLVDTANFGDCHDRRSAHTAAVYARLAGLYDIGEAQWLYHHFYRRGEWQREGEEGLVKPGLWAESGLEFMWYDPSTNPSPVDRLPLQRIFPDLGLVSARSSWQPDALMLAFKCGAPNGIKAWHTGHAINRKKDWMTHSVGHDHPDANSFILIHGADYIAVDDGYAKSKLTAHHSTLLVDGRGQYAEGQYNAFRDLDDSWSARLEATFACDKLVYARGEAARAYDRSLDLRQFTREIIVLADDAVIINDTIESGMEHDYQWLLQTDAPAEPHGEGRFTIRAGDSVCQLHALQPDEARHRLSCKEITANPTSAKPDWIIRRLQHSLALSPGEPRSNCRFSVILDMAGFAVESQPAQRGLVASLRKEQTCWRIGIAKGRDGIMSDRLTVDGRFFAGRWHEKSLAQYLAVDVSSIWLDGELQLVADSPINIGVQRTDGELRLKAFAGAPTWLRFPSSRPASLRGNGCAADFKYDEMTGMVWIQLDVGETELVVN